MSQILTFRLDDTRTELLDQLVEQNKYRNRSAAMEQAVDLLLKRHRLITQQVIDDLASYRGHGVQRQSYHYRRRLKSKPPA